MASIRLSELRKSFGSIVAVRDISVEFEDGKLTSVLGPSGCGKTTTLNIIAGFIEPDAGTVHLGDLPVADPARGIAVPPYRRELGMVFQSYALWPHLSVADNVGYGLKMRGVARAEREAAVRTALARVRLENLIDRFPHELSGGQQQRVALARAIAYQPRILLFDEPLSNLDAQLREDMRTELKRIHREIGVTAVYVTHDQAEAMSLSDMIVVMGEGEILQQGTPRQLYEEPADVRVARFLGKSNLLEATVIGADASARDAALAQVEVAGFTGAVLARAPKDTRPRSRGVLSIRPEAITLKAGRDGQAGALVTLATYLGGQCHYEVSIGEARFLEVQQASDTFFPVGERVSIELNPNRCWFIAGQEHAP